MNKKIFIVAMLTTGTLAAQNMGINTETPRVTLDVNAEGNSLHQSGVQAPRLTRAELTAKGNALYGIDHVGALIYITDITGGDATGQREKIVETGYYLFDGQIWQLFIPSLEAKNIYTRDGELVSDRVVTQNEKTLTFTNTTKGGTVFANTTGTVDAQKAAVKIITGEQGDGKVLMSDEEGNVMWKLPGASVLSGTFLSGGRAGAVEEAGVSYNTGATITLPPGVWAVNIATELIVEKPAGATGKASRWGILYLSPKTDDSFVGIEPVGNVNTQYLAAQTLNFVHTKQNLSGSQIITVTGAEQTYNVFFVTNEGWGDATDSNFSSTGYKFVNSFSGSGKNTYFYAVKVL